VSKDGAVVISVEILEGFGKEEPGVGGPNIFVEVVVVVELDKSVGVEGPKRLLESLEPEPNMEPEEVSGVEDEFGIDFVPKPPKGDHAGRPEADDLAFSFSFSDDSSYSFCICVRWELYDSKALVKSENGSFSEEFLIKLESDKLSARSLV